MKYSNGQNNSFSSNNEIHEIIKYNKNLSTIVIANKDLSNIVIKVNGRKNSNDFEIGSNNYLNNSDLSIEEEDDVEVEAGEELEEQELIKLRNEFKRSLIDIDYEQAIKKLKKVEKFSEICVICVERYNPNDKIVLFYCNKHLFHSTCLKKWMETSTKCPLCKYDYLHLIVGDSESEIF